MALLDQLWTHFYNLSNDASPWLVLGLVISGLMQAWLNADSLSKHLGQGWLAIVKAAFVGAPLPLCSCGVIPVATQLRRNGASAPATASFLVATPETGVDSVSVTYALLGPIMAIYRPIAAILSALFTGGLVATLPSATAQDADVKATTHCCSNAHCHQAESHAPMSWLKRSALGIRYGFTQLVDDLMGWLIVGLVFATLVKTFVPTSFLTQFSSGLPAMLIMMVISIPMYICATASTPIAAGLILAGISPGTALVFMMAGPATNISTLGVIKNELGTAVLSRYLIGVAASAIAFGSLLDFLLASWQINIVEQMQHSEHLVSPIIALSCTLLLAICAVKPLRRSIIGA